MDMAKFYILDQNFNTQALLNQFESLLWVERYNSCGDFEIFTYPTPELIQYAVKNNYIWKSDSEYMMIIEELELVSTPENGVQFIIRGRSLESILDRRIIWNQTRVTSNIQTSLKRLITEAITSPIDSSRRIPNFVFQDTTNEYITTTMIDKQYTGDSLLEAVMEICQDNEVGFKVTLNENNQFVFSLYTGDDRSYKQNENPYVVFSPNYANLMNSNYYESLQGYRNVVLVAGAGEGAARKTRVVGNTSGLLRRELYADARDLRDTDENNNPIPDATYYANLYKRGLEKLLENEPLEYFEGEIDTDRLFFYKKDFYMGDIVQVANEFDMEGRARIVEFISSYNTDGIKQYPTFKIMYEEE